jgi:hypothetical protein
MINLTSDLSLDELYWCPKLLCLEQLIFSLLQLLKLPSPLRASLTPSMGAPIDVTNAQTTDTTLTVRFPLYDWKF